jgi:hypothetical protein
MHKIHAANFLDQKYTIESKVPLNIRAIRGTSKKKFYTYFTLEANVSYNLIQMILGWVGNIPVI